VTAEIERRVNKGEIDPSSFISELIKYAQIETIEWRPQGISSSPG
jgi:hypothetical protein